MKFDHYILALKLYEPAIGLKRPVAVGSISLSPKKKTIEVKEILKVNFFFGETNEGQVEERL